MTSSTPLTFDPSLVPGTRGSSRGVDASRRRSALFDALSFLVLPPLLFAVTGIGFISGDAIAQGGIVGGRDWHVNPNHLLLESFGRAWLLAVRAIGISAPAPDVLAWLSVFAGCVGLALFRLLVAPQLTGRRAVANFGTLVLACLSGFDRLWVSGEAHIIQIPFLVLHLGGAIALAGDARDHERAALAMAIAGAVGAVLAFISNALVIVAVTLALLIVAPRHRRRALLASVIVAGVVSGAVLAAVWAAGVRDVPFVSWLTSYAGGRATEQAVAGYGVKWSAAGLAVSAARSVYGLASSVVDLSPLSDLLRRHTGSIMVASAHVLGAAIALSVLAYALLIVFRSRQMPGRAGAAVIGAALALFAFGLVWNNSDDQFYFQLALYAAALTLAAADRVSFPRLVLPLAAIPLAVNARDFSVNYVGYPRAARLSALTEAVRGSALIIAPGRDEVGHLIFYAPPEVQAHTLFVSTFAETRLASEGLPVLRDTVAAVLASGRRVALINIGGEADRLQPWPLLGSLGYQRVDVAQAIWHGHVVRHTAVTPTTFVDIVAQP